MANPQSKALLNENVTFIQNASPGFEAGTYRLEITQTLSEAKSRGAKSSAGEGKSDATGMGGGKRIDDGDLRTSYDFAVSGERFSFAQPDKAVFCVFPADNSSGNYQTVLPHAVFAQATLPWMRSPSGRRPAADAQGDIPTWLWVMLLDERDVAAHQGASLDPATGVIGDLFPGSVYTNSTLPADGVSYFSAGGDASALEPGQQMSNPIQFIDVPRALFDQVAPRIEDLRLMAHVRKVSLVRKPTIAQVSDRGVPVGSFSIVFGNRLAQIGVNTRCYLVSLEAMAPYLPGGGSAGGGVVRLAVLRSWRFRASDSPAGFVDGIKALNAGTHAGDAGGAGVRRRTALQRPYSGDNSALKSALAMGYVPLDTVMRTGEKTISWYRGPLAPYAETRAGPRLPLSSADAGLIFDPISGVFDMSYAAAWTLGRMLALQDQSFSVPLYVWKQGLHADLMAGVCDRILAERVADIGMARRSTRAAGASASSFDEVLHTVINTLGQGARRG